MKRVAVLLGLLCGLACAAGEKVRVLTYNIHHGEGTDGKLDLERIAAVIRSVDPDFVAVQEVDIRATRTRGMDQAAELGRLARMHAVFAKTIDHQGGWYGNALLSRWPVQGMKAHSLPFTPGREKRGILEGAAILPVPLRFFAMHFDITEADRVTSAEAMAQLTAGAPAVLAGDLNAVPGSKPIQALLDAGWTSAAPPTLLTSPAEAPKRQIDFVMFYPRNKWRVVEVRVLDEPVASDHRPLFVILESN